MEWSDGCHPTENIFKILVAIRNEMAEQNEEIRKLTKAVDCITDNGCSVNVSNVGKD